MKFRLTQIITKTGDKGTTDLANGTRISKGSQRMMAIGGMDELNTALGVLRAYITDPAIINNLIAIQRQLLYAGTQIAGSHYAKIEEHHIKFLEEWADILIQQLEPLQDFVLPGGSIAAAHCHVARVTCRRTERYVIAADIEAEFSAIAIQYLNRLSDVLFILARVLNKQENVPEIIL